MASLTKKLLLFGLFLFIFFFWLELAKNNFFHWDEWELFMTFNKPLHVLLTSPYNEHYIPLNILWHYTLFHFFHLNYLPFQIGVAFFHGLNTCLLYLITKKEIKSRALALTISLLYGLGNVSIENTVWSLGINYILSGSFIFLSYFLLEKFEGKPKIMYLILSGIFLVISPLFHDITILMPMAFALICIFRTKNVTHISSLTYISAQIVNLCLLFSFSQGKVFSNTGSFSLLTMIKIPIFIIIGVYRGNIIRLLLPETHFLKNGALPETILLLTFSLIFAIASILLIVKFLSKKTTRQKNIALLIRFALLVTFPYIAAAPARIAFGIGQAGISRYTYVPFFFLLVLAVHLISLHSKHIRFIIVTIVIIILVNIYANLNFNNNFWAIMTRRDKDFSQEISYLFRKNDAIYDLEAPGINPKIKLSGLWFLFPEGKNMVFYQQPANAEDILKTTKDQTSKNIYTKLLTNYKSKFD